VTPAPTLISLQPDGARTEDLLSFRHLLNDAMLGFLAGEHLVNPALAECLAELIVSLSSYREEGAALFPRVFLTEKLEALLDSVSGQDAIRVGHGTLGWETVRLALKACAPLAQNNWYVWLEAGRDNRLCYGIFRNDASPLATTPMEALRQSRAPERKLVGVLQLADNIIELCGASGHCRYVYLSGVRPDVRLPSRVVADMVASVTRHVSNDVRTETEHFFRTVFWGVMMSAHGSLVAVLPAGTDWHPLFEDGIRLEQPLTPVTRIREFRSSADSKVLASLGAQASMIQSLTGVDGITVLRSDGAVLGYNVFIRPEQSVWGAQVGGARKRTFSALCRPVGTELVAAFCRSQDGFAECHLAPDARLAPVDPDDFGA
jgi:hypothetical protein